VTEIKLTKNSLREQQVKLNQLNRYLPTLQLKKAMLQTQVFEVKQEIEALKALFTKEKKHVHNFCSLLSASQLGVVPQSLARVLQVQKHIENIAGVDVPVLQKVVFEDLEYGLMSTPPWLDALMLRLRSLVEAEVKVEIAKEKKDALEHELREVSIRVNLFEKVLIPRAKANIKRIKIFLGDQELAAVAQAKAAKREILEKKMEHVQHAD
jgi:V/A-type H+-transporting ATPase subunit D